ncbi:Ku protein [Streptomyces polygonati]|uniref:Ku protein n=1 Tax=Streptomyces polygonati TaxID=1617087 RepID=A0ABV8I3I7_9ACTN
MPPIWSGTLTFGLVAIPVRMESATRSHRVAFRQIHAEDQGRVRYTKVCELDEHPLSTEDIGRAYEAPDGTLVPIEDRELDEMPLPTAKTIEISGFLELGGVPPAFFDRPYFLAPASAAANKPYVLMREALARSGKAAVGKYAVRGAGEALGLIHAKDDILVLQRLHWPDEIRPADDAAPKGDVEITDDERAAADQYIRAVGDIDMRTMRDEYAEAVRQLVEAKAQHKAPPEPARPEPEDTGVTDLMTTLQRATEQARAEHEEKAEVHKMPAKKSARKKTPAKKTTRKRAG